MNAIEKLTKKNGMYPSRSELVRFAVREFLIKELQTMNTFSKLQGISQKKDSELSEILLEPVNSNFKKIKNTHFLFEDDSIEIFDDNHIDD